MTPQRGRGGEVVGGVEEVRRPGGRLLTLRPVSTPGGETWLLYHAWPPDAIGSVVPGRQLWLDRVEWPGGRPVVRGPSPGPQPMPR